MTDVPLDTWTGHYRAGRHGGGDCVYFQTGPAPTKQDPRVCIAFPEVGDGNRVVTSAATIAASIINCLNAVNLGDSARATGWLLMPAGHDAGWNTVLNDIVGNAYECAGCGGMFLVREEHPCPGGVVFALDEPGTFIPGSNRFMLAAEDPKDRR